MGDFRISRLVFRGADHIRNLRLVWMPRKKHLSCYGSMMEFCWQFFPTWIRPRNLMARYQKLPRPIILGIHVSFQGCILDIPWCWGISSICLGSLCLRSKPPVSSWNLLKLAQRQLPLKRYNMTKQWLLSQWMKTQQSQHVEKLRMVNP